MVIPLLCIDWHLKFNAEMRRAFNTEDSADLNAKIRFFQFPAVVEVWSTVLISSSRNVHLSSCTMVSPLSNNEKPCMCVTCAS